MRGILETTFLHNPEMGLFCHAPTILETSTGDLLCAWYSYPEVEYKNAQLILVRRQKGKPWESSQQIISNQRYSEGNPVLFEETCGRIWLLFVVLKGIYWTDAELNGRCSDDGGNSWSPALCLWKEHGMMVRHPPLLLKNGSFALPAYDEIRKEALLLTSPPPYQNWQTLFRFTGLELLQPVLIRHPFDNSESQLTLFFRPWSNPRVIWRSHSNDEGANWTTPLRTNLPNPLSGISAFTVGPHMAVVYNHTHEHNRHPLSISISRNRGVTWDKPIHLDTAEHEVSYPSFLNGKDDIIHGVYTYSRTMIKYVSLNEMTLLEERR